MDGVVGARRAERSRGRLVGADDEPPPHPRGVGVLDHRGERDRAAGIDVGGDLAQLGEGLAGDALDVHVEDPAAGQADGERVVVGDAVPLEGGVPEATTSPASS